MGLIYGESAAVSVQGDRMDLELTLTCSPRHFHQTFDQLHEVLDRIVNQPLDQSAFLSAKLDAAKELLAAEEDAGTALEEMQVIAAQSPERLTTPMAALMAVDEEGLGDFLHRLVDPERFVFTVVGPVLEDEIDGIGF
jgi:predicted Zn-dependent peptidase